MSKIKPEDFFEEKVKNNVWENNLEDVMAFIKSATDQDKFDEKGAYKPYANEWSWVQNMKCKYVELRIDMRDGGFILKDRDGNRISFDQLAYQCSETGE